LTVNSALNFVVYCAFNTVFRNRFRALVTMACRRPWLHRGVGRDSAVAHADIVELATIQRVSQKHRFSSADRCSLVVSGNQSLVIICSNSSGNNIELMSVNHGGVV